MIFPQPAPPRRAFRLPRVVRIILIALALALIAPYLLAPLYNFGQPVSTLMLARWAILARVERSFVPIAEVSPALTLAVVTAEDGRFCEHHGIDWKELSNALSEVDDLEDARGGSTITQQLAKNLFLWGGRSYVRKVLEAPLALWLDLVLPKRRIVELYLNVVEWGPNGEFGAEAGSRYAFGKSARLVGRQEAALLVAVLPNPIRRSARAPGPAVRRLAAIYGSRAAGAPRADFCVRKGP